MSQQPQRMLNLDATEPQLASFDQPMHVIAETNSNLCHSHCFMYYAAKITAFFDIAKKKYAKLSDLRRFFVIQIFGTPFAALWAALHAES
jgi:hypothetical protein